jgi:hypothetical protein
MATSVGAHPIRAIRRHELQLEAAFVDLVVPQIHC